MCSLGPVFLRRSGPLLWSLARSAASHRCLVRRQHTSARIHAAELAEYLDVDEVVDGRAPELRGAGWGGVENGVAVERISRRNESLSDMYVQAAPLWYHLIYDQARCAGERNARA